MSYAASFVESLLDHYTTNDTNEDAVNQDANLLFDAVNMDDYDSIIMELERYQYELYLDREDFVNYFRQVIEMAKQIDAGDSTYYDQLLDLIGDNNNNNNNNYRELLEEYYDQDIMEQMDNYANTDGERVYQDAYNQIILYENSHNQPINVLFSSLMYDNYYAFTYYFNRIGDTLSLENLNELYYLEQDKRNPNNDILKWIISTGARPANYENVRSTRNRNIRNIR